MTLNSAILAGFLALVCVLPASAQTQYETADWPDVSPDITSAMLSRTSITVRNIEKSLELYRDILGMTPFYERENLTDPRLVPFSGMTPEQKMRLVVLRIETEGIAKMNAGYLGLAEIYDGDGKRANLPRRPSSGAAYGEMAMLFVVADVRAVYEAVKTAGYEIISAPKQRENGSVSQLLMRGPDGERLWITQGELSTPFIQKRAQ